MNASDPQRYDRFYEEATKESDQDQRKAGQRDRDRILYSSFFRRLAGVTQVANPHEEYTFHNRLTHTLEVAQIARRLAEKLIGEHESLLDKVGGVDPDVVEAAALAHDLGHPPFGHIGERELDRLAKIANAVEGFESNAQSFRIITKLAAQRAVYNGFNLSRATLNAVLKYPWFHDADAHNNKHFKFGAYSTEADVFWFARDKYRNTDRRSVEAAIMDYADDVAYSVHDLDDFYRVGLIPLEKLIHSNNLFDAFLKTWVESGVISEPEVKQARRGLRNLLDTIVTEEQYSGTLDQRAFLRSVTSRLIKDFIFAVTLDENTINNSFLHIDRTKLIELKFLKQLVWVYVINDSRLASQHSGYRQVIRTLFQTYLEAVQARNEYLVPPRFRHDLSALGPNNSLGNSPNAPEARLTVDIISGFTDEQAVAMYKRLIGVSPGSIVSLFHR